MNANKNDDDTHGDKTAVIPRSTNIFCVFWCQQQCPLSACVLMHGPSNDINITWNLPLSYICSTNAPRDYSRPYKNLPFLWDATTFLSTYPGVSIDSRVGHEAGPREGGSMRVVYNLLIHTSLTLFSYWFLCLCVNIVTRRHGKAVIGKQFAKVNYTSSKDLYYCDYNGDCDKEREKRIVPAVSVPNLLVRNLTKRIWYYFY